MRLVTSSYHMLRSAAEFRAVMPDIEILSILFSLNLLKLRISQVWRVVRD